MGTFVTNKEFDRFQSDAEVEFAKSKEMSQLKVTVSGKAEWMDLNDVIKAHNETKDRVKALEEQLKKDIQDLKVHK